MILSAAICLGLAAGGTVPLTAPLGACSLLASPPQVQDSAGPPHGAASVPGSSPAGAALPAAREKELLRRIHELEVELRHAQELSFRRNQEWIAYIRVLRGVSDALPEPPAFIAEALVPEIDPVEEARRREEQRLVARGRDIQSSLRSLLTVEGVRNIDFLEVGTPKRVDGRAVTGPVIARHLDDRGRMIGMLKADRMRIETSRSSRSVTIVLEDGYDSRLGLKRPFEDGTRRIFLGAVNPERWIDAFPDLVDAASLEPVIDDGMWDVGRVRSRISRLLARSAEKGGSTWRILGLGGVRDGKLRDIQLGEVDSTSGRIARRVFADVGEIRARAGQGVEIELADGTVRRGDRVAPFLDGRFRLVLPYADGEAWKAAELPGLSVPGLSVPGLKEPAPGTPVRGAPVPGSATLPQSGTELKAPVK